MSQGSESIDNLQKFFNDFSEAFVNGQNALKETTV